MLMANSDSCQSAYIHQADIIVCTRYGNTIVLPCENMRIDNLIGWCEWGKNDVKPRIRIEVEKL